MRFGWWLAIGVMVSASLLIGSAVLAQGAGAADPPTQWTALNALVNLASLIGYAIAAVVAWASRSISNKLKRIESCLGAFVDWQRESYDATKANVTLLATKQNEHERACVREHGPMDGRPAVPEIPLFDWPAPPQRRATDRKSTF